MPQNGNPIGAEPRQEDVFEGRAKQDAETEIDWRDGVQDEPVKGTSPIGYNVPVNSPPYSPAAAPHNPYQYGYAVPQAQPGRAYPGHHIAQPGYTAPPAAAQYQTGYQAQSQYQAQPQYPAAPYSPQAQPGQQAWQQPGAQYPGYGVPPQGQAYPQYHIQYPASNKPKKTWSSMPLAMQIFVIVFIALVGISAAGAVYLVGAGIVGSYNYQRHDNNIFEDYQIPEGNQPQIPPDILPEEIEPEVTPYPEIVQPDIDIPKNSKGMSLNDKPMGAEMDPKDVYDKVLVSTVTVKAQIPTSAGIADSVGTGIILSEDGFMMTNSHVVGNTKKAGVTIITSDGKEHPAVVVGVDKATDLAVLKADDMDFTPAEIGNSDQLAIGDWVMAVGNPGGSSFSGSLTRGVVSGLDRTVGNRSAEAMTYIQTDAAINPGNSGGPLVNMYGQVVGINSSKIVADYYEGMSFSIPVNKAKTIVDELISKGYISGRVRLGITGSDIGQQQAMLYGVPQGILVASIAEDSPLAGTELQPGDIITEVDGHSVQSLNALSSALLAYSPGDTIEITVYRMSEDGQSDKDFKVSTTLLADEGETQK